jgi:hypothetical protein
MADASTFEKVLEWLKRSRPPFVGYIRNAEGLFWINEPHGIVERLPDDYFDDLVDGH